MSLSEWIIKKVVTGWLKKQKENPMFKWLEGKRTYCVMAITAILGAVGALNQAGITHIVIPDVVFTVLAGIGWYTRSIAKPKA